MNDLKINDRIRIVESASGKQFSSDTRNTLKICLENAEKSLKIYESTDYGAMTGIKNFTLDLISVVVPNLVAEKIVSVQPIKNQVGVINYIRYIYSNDKGRVKAGDVFASALNENNTDMYYSSEEIDAEAIEFSANKFTGTLAWTPVLAGTLAIEGVTTDGKNFVIKDATGGDLQAIKYGQGMEYAQSGSLVRPEPHTNPNTFIVLDRYTNEPLKGATATGTVNYKTGAIDITVSGITVKEEDETFSANYRYNQRSIGDGQIGSNQLKVPEVQTEIKPIPVTARSRKLKALFSFDSLIVMQQEYGQDLRKLVEMQVAAEIIHEIDGEIMNDLFLQAGETQGAWSAVAPVGVSKRDHYETFLFHINRASNMIFGKTKKVRGNFIIAGLDVASIIEMAVNFKPVNVPDSTVGPHIIGNLGQFLVIKNPYYGTNDYLVGYKGSSLLDAGYVYAPYLPITSTGSVMLDDFVSRQGWMSIYAKKMLNPSMYVRGSISWAE